MRHETTRLLVENTGSKLLDIGLMMIFFNLISKAKATKRKINK